MIPEILAPAGSFEALVAAVRCGANAVYLGGRILNARRNATNFSDEQLEEAVSYCHKRNVMVYVTVNTLVTDDEFPDVINGIKFLNSINVDALIVQDIGLASLTHSLCPELPLHASTQMSVQSIEGIKELEKMGFKRAVLPRELSEKEIRVISSKTNMELEYFVHGALCMCLSGQCLMSSVIGGRSGNRGLCAQPCRLPFGVNDRGGNNLSLKDLSLIDKISALSEAGICSLKIEGRMKRPEYVAAAVTACRNAINNTSNVKITDSLSAVFSRSGFTSGYFDGKLGKDMFGIRTKENVESSSSVLKELSHLYDNETPFLAVNLFFNIQADSYPELSVYFGDISVKAVGDIKVDKAVNKALSFEELSSRLRKTGGTQFRVNEISGVLEDNLFMSASSINNLRRTAFQKLEEELSERNERQFNLSLTEFSKHKSDIKHKLFASFFYPEQIPEDLSGLDRVIIPLSTSDFLVSELLKNNSEVAAEIPVNVYSNSDKYKNELVRLKGLGIERVVCSNLDGIGIVKELKMKISGGFGMNVINSHSASFLEHVGFDDILLSCEISEKNIGKIGGDIDRGLLTYGRMPLMVTRNCPIKNKINCDECKKSSFLVDRMNVQFPVRCRNGCSFIFNSLPVFVGDKINRFSNIDYELLYFSIETKEECKKIIDNYKNNIKPDGEITNGLYFRTVL